MSSFIIFIGHSVLVKTKMSENPPNSAMFGGVLYSFLSPDSESE